MDTCSAVKPVVEKLRIFSTGAMDRTEMCSPADLYGKPCTCNDDLYEIRYGDCVCQGKYMTAYQNLRRTRSKENHPYSQTFPRDVMHRSESQEFAGHMEFEETYMFQNCEKEKAKTKATKYDQITREDDEIGFASPTETSLQNVSSAEISLDENGGTSETPQGYPAAKCVDNMEKSDSHCVQDSIGLLDINPRKETSQVTNALNDPGCSCEICHLSVSSRESANKNNGVPCVCGQKEQLDRICHNLPEMKETLVAALTVDHKYNHQKTIQSKNKDIPRDPQVGISGERRLHYIPVTFGSLDMAFTCDPSPRFILAPPRIRLLPSAGLECSVPVLVPCSP